MEETSYMTVAVSYAYEFIPPLTGKDVQVEAIEAVCDSCKFRLTFKGARKIAQTFFRELRHEILQKLADFEQVDGLLSIPDYHFSCATLSLRRLSVFGSERGNHRKVVTLRWSKVAGSIQSVLKECPDTLRAPQSENARMAYQVLNCVLEPIFDLTDTEHLSRIDVKQSSTINELLEDLSAKRDELRKYARMLEIYLKYEASARDPEDDEDVETSQFGSRNQRYLC